jgi:hypothetical protein
VLQPQSIDLCLLGVERPDLLYSTPDHQKYLIAGRVKRHAVVFTRCAMDGDDIPLADVDVHELGAQCAVRQGPRRARTSSGIFGQPARSPE